jgi:hypothetical protein
MLCHFRLLDKRMLALACVRRRYPSKIELCRSLARNIMLAPPPREHPFWMFRQPVRRIFLSPDKTGERRHILDRPLLDARAGRGLEAEDEHERGHP